MRIEEIVRMQNGEEIKVGLVLGGPEHTAIFTAGVNFLVAQGFLSLDSLDGKDRIGRDDLIEELDAQEEEVKKEIAH